MKKEIQLKGFVYKDNNAWEALKEFLNDSDISSVYILCDENTLTHCLPILIQKHNFKNTPHIITIAAGETHKTIDTCLKVWKNLAEKRADRNSLIINLGGGVVTDLGGFVASTFKRGVHFINIPTSLLAMVDASVGGKNGVDLGHVKNQIGVINPPEMVILDTGFLNTLPIEHITSGLAEMLKHGIIYNKEYWERIKKADFTKKEAFEDLIWDSIEIKKEIVSKDPLEKNLRKTLNYGHTLGHAIESYFLENSDKKELLHGEAVAVGIILATYISKEMCHFPIETLNEISESILKHFSKQIFSENDIEAIINLLVFDKKNRNGQVLFVLMEDIGVPKIDCVIDNELIYSAFNYYKNF
ncbi:3-dehydroquinate synthase [Aequorivita capsosiphonis]|uniref:3-dehydroquinate synthase n=1 Tax=Aequorivita capsosiphonis TaxID=487317 RepID=UPI000420B444|nr:3-dehydroquinate synthase [Aequorivita capsosiphonis]